MGMPINVGIKNDDVMRRIVLMISLLLGSWMMMAQNLQRPVDTLKFAHFEADTLVFDTETSLLVPFFHKFDSVVKTHNGHVSILHIGGSHVQAGTMSHRIRKNLLNAYPGLTSSRGFIFPYSAAKKCNNPADYSVKKKGSFTLVRNVYKTLDKPLGVGGIAVYTSDSLAEIKIKMNDKSLEFQTDRITLFGFSDKGTVLPAIDIDSTEYLPISIDTALRRFVFEVPTIRDSFLIRLVCDTIDTFTITGILLENNLPGITFHSIGVNGASVPSYLKCDYFEPDLELIHPDLVIFGIGINDASTNQFDTAVFQNNYLQLIEEIKHVNPDCAFIFLTNNDSYKRVGRGKYVVNQNGTTARKVFYNLAQLTNGAVWDQFYIMGGLRSMEKWRQAKLAQYDRVHFTVAGYNLIGDLFFNAFIHAKDKVCQ